MVLLRNPKTIDIAWLRFVATLAIYKVSANVDVFAKQGAFVFISLVAMPVNTLIAYLIKISFRTISSNLIQPISELVVGFPRSCPCFANTVVSGIANIWLSLSD
jgi:hypothetical protein